MGQYHYVVAMNGREYLHPHQLGAGLKAWEIIANPSSLCAALVGLISVKPGNGPADVGNNKSVGRWAGQRILAVGDYAEDGDIPNFDGPPLSKIYSLCGALADGPKFDEDFKKWHGGENAAQAFEEALKEWAELKKLGFFTNVSPDCQGMIEQACSVRICDTGGWLTKVPVRQMATAKVGDVAVYELVHNDPETLEYYKRCGVKPRDWQRVPKDGSWHGVRDAEIDQGQTRVLASLDLKQFIDPAVFGEVATTAGIMRGDGGSAAALTAMLFHADRRGGGDLSENGDLVGAWRNTRLIASAETGDQFPTTDEIKSTFENISDRASAMIAREIGR